MDHLPDWLIERINSGTSASHVTFTLVDLSASDQ